MLRANEELTTRAAVQAMILNLASGTLDEIEAHIRENINLDAMIPGFRELAGCEQGGLHQEGDALVHTAKVFANVAQLSKGLPDEDRYLLLIGALLHDITKPAARAENGGRVSFHGHAESAADMCPDLAQSFHLTDSELDRVTFLVRNHMNAHLIRSMGENRKLELYKSPHFSLLVILQEADALATWSDPEGVMHPEVQRDFMESDRRTLLDKETAAALMQKVKVEVEKTLRERGINPGPYYGEVKKAAQTAARNGEAVTTEQIREFVEEYLERNPPG